MGAPQAKCLVSHRPVLRFLKPGDEAHLWSLPIRSRNEHPTLQPLRCWTTAMREPVGKVHVPVEIGDRNRSLRACGRCGETQGKEHDGRARSGMQIHGGPRHGVVAIVPIDARKARSRPGNSTFGAVYVKRRMCPRRPTPARCGVAPDRWRIRSARVGSSRVSPAGVPHSPPTSRSSVPARCRRRSPFDRLRGWLRRARPAARTRSSTCAARWPRRCEGDPVSGISRRSPGLLTR